MTSEYRPEEEYSELLGGLTGQELFGELQNAPPPEGLSPLPFSDIFDRRLRAPLMHELSFPALRRDLTRELRGIVANPSLGLDADEETVYDLRQGLSEAVQNSFRNDRGVYQIDVQRTASGGLYAAVHNISVIYPAGTILHLREGQRPLRLGSSNEQPRKALPDDEHGWGLGLIGRFALQGNAQSMGFYRDIIADIPDMNTGQQAQIARLVFWSVYGKSDTAELPRAA